MKNRPKSRFCFPLATSYHWFPLVIKEPEIDPSIPLELGRIVMRWSRVEEAFDSNMGLLAALPRAKLLLPDEMPISFKKRLKLWHRLVRATFAEFPHYLKIADEIRTSAALLADWRNNLIHGWITVESNGLKVVITKPGSPRTVQVFRGIQLSQLVTVSNDIKRLEDELLALELNQFVLRTHLAKPKP